LKLFSASGRFLDSFSFPDPKNRQRRPETISFIADTMLVWQKGRLTFWQVANDRLVLRRELPVDGRLFPFGATTACGEHWLYARNDEQFEDSTTNSLDYIHRVNIEADGVRTEATYQDSRDSGINFLWWGHSAKTLSGNDTGFSLWHRSDPANGGRILEFDCSGSLIAEASETSLVVGDTLPVKAARTRPLEWTGGLVRTPRATIVGVHRYFSHAQGADPHYWNNEFLFLVDGKLAGSVLVDRQWNIMDYSPATKMVLLTSFEPEYHFVQINLQSLWNARSE